MVHTHCKSTAELNINWESVTRIINDYDIHDCTFYIPWRLSQLMQKCSLISSSASGAHLRKNTLLSKRKVSLSRPFAPKMQMQNALPQDSYPLPLPYPSFTPVFKVLNLLTRMWTCNPNLPKPMTECDPATQIYQNQYQNVILQPKPTKTNDRMWTCNLNLPKPMTECEPAT